MAFDLEGIAVSAGSACSSGKVSASQVMAAMGMPPELGRSGIRVSLPAGVEAADIEGFIVAWRAIHARMVESRAA
jgi:cysteine desulfurase